MFNKKTFQIITIFLLFSLVWILPTKSLGSATATPTNTDFRDCSAINGKPDPDCQAASLLDAQLMVVQLIGTAWALGGLVFFFLLVTNGSLYLMSYIDELKYIIKIDPEDAQKRMIQWAIGFVLFFLSYPIVASLLKLIINENTSCYDKLRVPGFTFIFYDVCVKDPTTPTPTP